MNVRDKLVELMEYARQMARSECKKHHNCVGCPVQNYRKDDICQDMLCAEELIANGVTVQEWVSVKDRLPNEDVRVLVWVGENSCNFPVIDTDKIHNGRWVRWNKYTTHWMPLPQPPSKGE